MESVALGAVPAALNFTFRSAQAGFELQQAPKETRELFRTISSTRSDIVHAKEKRASLVKVCSAQDIGEWDRSIKELESALSSLEQLVELARVDMQHNKGKVGLRTKALWVLRDSKSLSATHDRLSLAYARMGFCYQRLQFSATQSARMERRNNDEPVESPPTYLESTSQAIAARRREERQRLERSESVRSVLDTTHRSHGNDLSRAESTRSHGPIFELDQQTSTYPARGGLQNTTPSTYSSLRRTATDSVINETSNGTYSRYQDLDRSISNASAGQPSLQPRSLSMPYPNRSMTVHDQTAFEPSAVRSDYGPSLLSSDMSQLSISHLRNANRPDPETMSMSSFEQRCLNRGGFVASQPAFELSSSPHERSDSLALTYTAPPQYQSTNQSSPPSDNMLTVSERHTSEPAASSLRTVVPYTAPRNTVAQSYHRPAPAIAEDDEYMSPVSPCHSELPFRYSGRARDERYGAPPSDISAPTSPPVPKTIPTSPSTRNGIGKTRRLFAGQRGTKEIRYEPYVGD